MSLRNRLIVIGVLVGISAYSLFPRTTIERVNRGGQFVYDTVRRVPLKRGLDLQGGMHLALEIDESRGTVADSENALDRALQVVRNRIDEFGVSEPIVQKVGSDRIIVELPGIDDPERAQQVVQKSAFLQFQITDKTQALERVAPRLDAIVRDQGLLSSLPPGVPADTARGTGLQSLFKADTTAAVTDSAAGDTAAALPAAQGDGPFSRMIAPAGIPGMYVVQAKDVATLERLLAAPAIQAALPPGKVVRWGTDTTEGRPGLAQQPRALYVLDSRPIVTGEGLVDAQPQQDPTSGTVVTFQLNNEAGRRFRAETGRHVGDYMAIVLDDKVMSAPVIQSAIGTRGQITMGNRSDVQGAQDLALVLRAGALPVPLKVAEVRNIGASLGQDAIRQGLFSGALGIVLVVLIMIGYYRFSGFLAVCGLAFYVLVTLAILAGFDATLTLPGLAGFVLSIGMAVDANFLIFERIREELDAGRTTRLAIDEGFNHAWSAIIDTHVTTALTAAILYQFGTGPVRGFAVALLAGLAASLVSAIFVVRTLFYAWLTRAKPNQPLSI
jgi:preprotein translocase subunit SecD